MKRSKPNFNRNAQVTVPLGAWILTGLSNIATILTSLVVLQLAFALADGGERQVPTMDEYGKNGLVVQFKRDGTDNYSCVLKIKGEYEFRHPDERMIAVIRNPDSKNFFTQTDADRNLGSWGVWLYVGSREWPIHDGDSLEVKLIVVPSLKGIPESVSDLSKLKPNAASPTFSWTIKCR